MRTPFVSGLRNVIAPHNIFARRKVIIKCANGLTGILLVLAPLQNTISSTDLPQSLKTGPKQSQPASDVSPENLTITWQSTSDDIHSFDIHYLSPHGLQILLDQVSANAHTDMYSYTVPLNTLNYKAYKPGHRLCFAIEAHTQTDAESVFSPSICMDL